MNQQEFQNILQDKCSGALELYSPLRLSRLQFEFPLADVRIPIVDAVFDITWQDRKLKFVGELQPSATPRKTRNAVEEIQHLAKSVNLVVEPALLVPYLSSGIVEELEGTGVSSFDLCGNFYVQTSELLAIRLDQPNEYPASRDIKKIYSYNSSIVGRFLLREVRQFEQVNEIYEKIQARGGGVSLSTVSKVLKGLTGDLIIEKKRGCIRVLQPRELLQRLQDGYRSPRIGATMKLDLPADSGEPGDVLSEFLGTNGWIWSGESSAQAYTATTPPATPTAYTPEFLSTAASPLREYEDERFYNCILKQTEDSFVYFDRNGSWASPIETCLALSQLDKRERELSRSIKDTILSEFSRDI